MQQAFARQGFEGRYQRFSTADTPSSGRAQRQARDAGIEGPTFDRPLNDLEVSLGGEAVFTCVVAGRPQPEVTWYVHDFSLGEKMCHVYHVSLCALNYFLLFILNGKYSIMQF